MVTNSIPIINVLFPTYSRGRMKLHTAINQQFVYKLRQYILSWKQILFQFNSLFLNIFQRRYEIAYIYRTKFGL